MSKKKRIYVKKRFESTGQSDDTSANIYMSMLTHDNFRKLTDRQVRLYLYCKAQYYAEKKKPIIKQTGETSVCFFTMNQLKWNKLYNLYSVNTQRYFYRDMQVLIDLGFVKLVESGKYTRTKNIYKLSDKWHK